MFAVNRCARVLACLAAFGMLASPVLGAKPIPGGQQVKQNVFDVKLADGHLLGQVVNANGLPESGSRVALLSQSSAIASTEADSHGRFSLPVEKPGAYRVLVADRAVTVRTWRPEVAPPNAKSSLLCVAQHIVRGQCDSCGAAGLCGCDAAAACGSPARSCLGGFRNGRGMLTNPVIIGLGVAAAIALPIALNDDDDDNNGGNQGAGEPAS